MLVIDDSTGRKNATGTAWRPLPDAIASQLRLPIGTDIAPSDRLVRSIDRAGARAEFVRTLEASSPDPPITCNR